METLKIVRQNNEKHESPLCLKVIFSVFFSLISKSFISHTETSKK